MFGHLGGYILQLVGVVPDLVEQAQEGGGGGGLIHPVDDVRHGIAALVAQVNGGKAVQGHVDAIRMCSRSWGACVVARGQACVAGMPGVVISGKGRRWGAGWCACHAGCAVSLLYPHELLHGRTGPVAAKLRLATDPVGAFPGHGPLGELVAQLDFKRAAGQAALTVGVGNVKLPPFLANPVGGLSGREGRGGEDELQGFYLLQLRLQCLVGVHREAGGGNFQAGARLDGLFEVVTQQTADVVDQLHPSRAPVSLLASLWAAPRWAVLPAAGDSPIA